MLRDEGRGRPALEGEEGKETVPPEAPPKECSSDAALLSPQ